MLSTNLPKTDQGRTLLADIYEAYLSTDDPKQANQAVFQITSEGLDTIVDQQDRELIRSVVQEISGICFPTERPGSWVPLIGLTEGKIGDWFSSIDWSSTDQKVTVMVDAVSSALDLIESIRTAISKIKFLGSVNDRMKRIGTNFEEAESSLYHDYGGDSHRFRSNRFRSRRMAMGEASSSKWSAGFTIVKWVLTLIGLILQIRNIAKAIGASRIQRAMDDSYQEALTAKEELSSDLESGFPVTQ